MKRKQKLPKENENFPSTTFLYIIGKILLPNLFAIIIRRKRRQQNDKTMPKQILMLLIIILFIWVVFFLFCLSWLLTRFGTFIIEQRFELKIYTHIRLCCVYFIYIDRHRWQMRIGNAGGV